MNKEEYRKAFNAGKEYWQWVQTDEPMLHKPIDFDEWYDTVVLPQANVIKSVCDNNKCQCQDATNFNRLICPICTPM